VRVDAGGASLAGDLDVPGGSRGIVLFAHGSGSGRLSPRNRLVAGIMRDAGFGTLLFDLLTGAEAAVDERTLEYRFDVELLGARLLAAARWLRRSSPLPFGYYGASTGAAAALIAAADEPGLVEAVVSRGGRPDLASGRLLRVRAPTLLIVGGRDLEVLKLNREAAARMTAVRRVEVVPGATHLFEETGKLEEAAGLAVAWFREYLR
jgi:pimeloyl-ACP methyl ester carboxylesterase